MLNYGLEYKLTNYILVLNIVKGLFEFFLICEGRPYECYFFINIYNEIYFSGIEKMAPTILAMKTLNTATFNLVIIILSPFQLHIKLY